MGQGILNTAGWREAGEGADVSGLMADAGLTRDSGTLRMAGVPLSVVAERVGTPAYVYNAEAIRAQFQRLDSALADVPHRICFAVKANSNLAVLRVLRDLGAGADIVSGGELKRVLAAGYTADRVVFSGVGKTEVELTAAVAAGLGHVNLESVEELAGLARIARASGREVRVGIRVNPAVTADTHPFISTGGRGIKFGIPADQVVSLARQVASTPHLRLTGIAMHLGSQLLDPAPYKEGLDRLAELVAGVRGAGVTTLESLDIGGGLGIRYAATPGMDPAELAATVVPVMKRLGLTLLLEPGRFLVGGAGVLLTSVLYRKHSGGKEFVVVDAGMNDLVRPSHYQAYHEIMELEGAGRPVETVDVVGPVCETGDFMALDRPLPHVVAGERLAILGAGAYGFVMSSTYNSRPRPPEVLVDGGRFSVVRERERDDELFSGERASPEWERA
ncbi:MAG TPA: diaminopimelate decarboxylase [Gemmatimonadales bacterium]|nr:diaminopimelate decarboxylase [Gemmatimonadales bacterium]